MLAKLGHKVMRLRRIAIGPVLLDKLPKGKSRKVTAAELEKLHALIALSQSRSNSTKNRAIITAIAPPVVEDPDDPDYEG